MTLREYTLSQMSISGITQKAMDKDGLGAEFLASATTDGKKLDLIYGVQSSHDDNRHVDFRGNPQPFLKREYSVRVTFTGIDKVVPADWNKQGIQKAKQYISQIVRNCDVKVHCDCPAFYWQGMHEDDAVKNTSYFNFMGTKGRGIWSARHQDAGVKKGQQMCKHIWAATFKMLDQKKLDEIITKLGVTDALQQPVGQQPQNKNGEVKSKVLSSKENETQQQVKESVLFESLLNETFHG